MNNNKDSTKQPVENKILLEDSTVYPIPEAVYNKPFEVDEKGTDNIAAIQNATGTENEKNGVLSVAGSDLDIPVSGLDEQHVAIGNENKENNYHDMGGES